MPKGASGLDLDGYNAETADSFGNALGHSTVGQIQKSESEKQMPQTQLSFVEGGSDYIADRII